MTMLGVHIEGIGTSRLTVHGGKPLGGGEFRFDEDFHEITTFPALGAITGGDVVVRNSAPENFPLIDRTFAKFGIGIVHEDGWSRVARSGPLQVQTPFTSNVLTKVEAAPWPYFPVDLLPIFIALGVRAQGNAMFWNKVYDGALGWTGELSKFGAHVFLRSSPPDYLRRQPAHPGGGGEPLHHPRGDRPVHGRRQHRRPLRDPQCHADPPRPSARGEPAQPGRAGGVDQRRLTRLYGRRVPAAWVAPERACVAPAGAIGGTVSIGGPCLAQAAVTALLCGIVLPPMHKERRLSLRPSDSFAFLTSDIKFRASAAVSRVIT